MPTSLPSPRPLRIALLALIVAMSASPLVGVAQQSQPPAAEASDEGSRPTLEGRWVIESMSAAERRRDAGVERCVDALPLLYRPIARSRIRRALPVPRRIALRIRGNRIRTLIGNYDLNFPFDGSSHPFTDPWGDDLHLSQRYTGTELRQRFVGGGGDKRHTLQLSDDGERMTLTVRIGSNRLPTPATYRATYRRAP